MSKQTAIDWLIKQLYPTISIRLSDTYIKELTNQAKAMEKAQIIRAFCEGYDHDGDNYDRAEIKYYEKTYGQ